MESLNFTIKLQPITKKGNQQILMNPKTGKPFVMPSKAFKKYEAQAMALMPAIETINEPVNVKCLFYMGTRRKCDLTNLLEAIDDIMVKAGILTDDNFTIIESHDGSRVLYDKEKPRTEIYIEKMNKNKGG